MHSESKRSNASCQHQSTAPEVHPTPKGPGSVKVTLVPDKFTRAYPTQPGKEPGGDVQEVDLLEALQATHANTPYISAYTRPGADVPRRLKKAAASEGGIECQAVLIDVDCPAREGKEQIWNTDKHRAWCDRELSRWKDGVGILSNAGFYTTGGGYRLVWQLSRALEPLQYERLLLAVQADLLNLGVEADAACKDWTRLYKTPSVDGSLPYKRELGRLATPLDVRGYDVEIASPLQELSPDRLAEVRSARQVATVTPMPDGAPEPFDWRSQAARRIKGLTDGPALQAGTFLPVTGHRHAEWMRVIGAVARVASSAGMVWQVIYPSYRAMCSQYPDSNLTKGWNAVQDVWQRESYRRQLEAAEEAFRRELDTKLRRVNQTAAGVNIPDTGRELLLYSAQPGQPTLAWRGSTQGFERVADAHIWPLLVQAKLLSPDGAENAKPVRLLTDFGTRYGELVYALGKSGVELACEGGELVVGTASLRTDVEPAYSGEVAGWLAALFGDRLEDGLDWIAGALQVDRPICALYLSGAAGTGKSLLGTLLSSCFGASPVPYQAAISRFNAALLKSPVVVYEEVRNLLDEADRFKSLVDGGGLAVEFKGGARVEVRGAPRVILSDNNGAALRTRTQKSRADLEALQVRIGQITVGPDARDYLLGVGGARIRKAWVEGGAFAAHALHLRDTRQLEGGRFIVDGWKSEVIAATGLLTGVNAELLAVVLEAVSDSQAPGVWHAVDAGVVAVHPASLLSAWDVYPQTGRAPHLSTMRDALAALSVGGVAVSRKDPSRKNRKVYLIPEGALRAVVDGGLSRFDTFEEAVGLGRSTGPKIIPFKGGQS